MWEHMGLAPSGRWAPSVMRGQRAGVHRLPDPATPGAAVLGSGYLLCGQCPTRPVLSVQPCPGSLRPQAQQPSWWWTHCALSRCQPTSWEDPALPGCRLPASPLPSSPSQASAWVPSPAVTVLLLCAWHGAGLWGRSHSRASQVSSLMGKSKTLNGVTPDGAALATRKQVAGGGCCSQCGHHGEQRSLGEMSGEHRAEALRQECPSQRQGRAPGPQPAGVRSPGAEGSPQRCRAWERGEGLLGNSEHGRVHALGVGTCPSWRYPCPRSSGVLVPPRCPRPPSQHGQRQVRCPYCVPESAAPGGLSPRGSRNQTQSCSVGQVGTAAAGVLVPLKPGEYDGSSLIGEDRPHWTDKSQSEASQASCGHGRCGCQAAACPGPPGTVARPRRVLCATSGRLLHFLWWRCLVIRLRGPPGTPSPLLLLLLLSDPRLHRRASWALTPGWTLRLPCPVLLAVASFVGGAGGWTSGA